MFVVPVGMFIAPVGVFVIPVGVFVVLIGMFVVPIGVFVVPVGVLRWCWGLPSASTDAVWHSALMYACSLVRATCQRACASTRCAISSVWWTTVASPASCSSVDPSVLVLVLAGSLFDLLALVLVLVLGAHSSLYAIASALAGCRGIRQRWWWDRFVLVAFALVAFVLLLALRLIYRVALVSNQILVL
jgi:hypothetical protein